MLNLIAIQAGIPHFVKPAACLIRKFSIDSGPGNTPGAATSDLDVCLNAMTTVATDSGLSVDLLIADTLLQDIHVSAAVQQTARVDESSRDSPGIELELTSNEQLIDEFIDHDNRKEINSARQLLLIAGLHTQTTETEHRNACLNVIRQIRQSRPAIYAQFVSWQQPANVAPQSHKAPVTIATQQQ